MTSLATIVQPFITQPKVISQHVEEQITPEEDKKLRLFAKLLVDKLFEDIHSGKVGNNGHY